MRRRLVSTRLKSIAYHYQPSYPNHTNTQSPPLHNRCHENIYNEMPATIGQQQAQATKTQTVHRPYGTYNAKHISEANRIALRHYEL